MPCCIMCVRERCIYMGASKIYLRGASFLVRVFVEELAPDLTAWVQGSSDLDHSKVSSSELRMQGLRV